MSRKRQRLSPDGLADFNLDKLGSCDPSRAPGGNLGGDDAQNPLSINPTGVRARKKPITTVDWRAELCRVLEQHNDVSDAELLDELDLAFDELKESRHCHSVQDNGHHGPPRHQVLYRVQCEGSRLDGYDSVDSESTTDDGFVTFEKPPWLVEHGPHKAHLRGGSLISNLELYLERNKDIAFLVYVDFRCCGEEHAAETHQPSYHHHPIEPTTLSLYTKESIRIISPTLQKALQNFAASVLEEIPHPDFLQYPPRIDFPYLWWFHRRDHIDRAIDELDGEPLRYVSLLRDYVVNRLRNDWATVDNLILKGLITLEYLEYIFVM